MPNRHIDKKAKSSKRRDAPCWRSALGLPVLRGYQRWRLQKAMRELESLNDRQLQDIGIARSDIPRLVENLLGDAESNHR